MARPEEVPAHVVEKIQTVLREIAPERAQELDTILREGGVCVTAVNEQHESPFVAIPERAEIRAHIPVIKRQLAMAFAYAIAYRAAEQASCTGARRLYLTDNPRAGMAVELLNWAMYERVMVARAKERGESPPDDCLPPHLDFPDPRAPKGSDDCIAISMFFTAMAADLHHELAHLSKGRGTGDVALAVRQEEEADEEAARWLIGDRTDGHPQFMGRILGLALSQTYEVFLTLEGFRNDPVHPPLVARLRNAVAGRAHNPDHAAWAFVATVLALHLELANRKHEYDRDREHPTFRHMAEYLMSVYENVRR
jgi:hypothetical protein